MKNLTDVQDELNLVKNFVVCIFMACESSMHPSDERSALCTVANAAREKLEAIDEALDRIKAEPPHGKP